MRGLTTTPLDKTTFEDVRESIDQCSRGDLLNESVSHYRLDLLKGTVIILLRGFLCSLQEAEF